MITYIKQFPNYVLKSFYYKVFITHKIIGLDGLIEDITDVDFGFSLREVKVTEF